MRVLSSFLSERVAPYLRRRSADTAPPSTAEESLGLRSRLLAVEALAQDRELQFALLSEATGDLVWDWDLASDVVTCRGGAKAAIGLPVDRFEFPNSWWLTRVDPSHRKALLASFETAFGSGQRLWSEEYRFRHEDGGYRWFWDRGVIVRSRDGVPLRVIGCMTDVSRQREAARQLFDRTAELAQRVRELRCLHAIAVACSDDHLSIQAVLEAAVHGLPSALTRPGEAVCEIAWGNLVLRSSEATGPISGVLEPIQAGNETVGSVALAYGRASAEQELSIEERDMLRTAAAVLGQMISQRADRDRTRHTATHDVLTGLPNRWKLQNELDALLRPDCPPQSVALLLLDLDHFKDVNDTLGHDAGDALLGAIGSRLQAAVGGRGTVARLGGDEFAIALAGTGLDEVDGLAEQLLESIRQPVRFAGRDILPRATIGVALAPDDGKCSAQLLKNADIALYAGKGSGRNAAVVYRHSMRDAIEERIRVCAEVRACLPDDVFVPYYQPKVSLRTRRVKGFEALLRWKHPSRGIQPAGSILPAFEDHELALQLGDRIRQHVFADMCRWRAQGVEFQQVAVNLSTAEFTRPDLAEHLLGQLEKCALSPRFLAVEVTETVLLGREAELVGPILGKLHDAGVQIALDDFGTGFASLTHLQKYPVDVIKIDQSFIRSILTDPGSQAITSAVLELGRRLGMTVVAEGVETAAHAELLRTAGCDEAQGFYFAKATPASRVPYVLGGSEQAGWGVSLGAARAS